MTETELKAELYAVCLHFAEDRIATTRKAMQTAQEAANEESKSSAGDKYETTRAMMQAERDRHATQLAEALKLKQELEEIKLGQTTDTVLAGSLVFTGQGKFFISVSAGKMIVNNETYFAVSAVSPVGKALFGKKAGETIEVNGKKMTIEKIS